MASAEDLEQARNAYRVLETLGAWLPLAWGVLVALALLAARHRRRTGVWLGAGSAVTLALLLPFLAVVKDGWWTACRPATRTSPEQSGTW